VQLAVPEGATHAAGVAQYLDALPHHLTLQHID
jgi:hypothetical protein